MAGNMENELNQLKEQIKLLERMVYLKNNVSSSEEYITKYMETQSKLSNIMKNYNMDSFNHEKKLVELLKQKAELEEKRAKSAKERVNAEKESIKNNETLKEQNKEIAKQTKEISEQEQKILNQRKQEAKERLDYAFKSKSERNKQDLSERREAFSMAHPDLKGDALVRELKKAGLGDNKSNELIKDSLKSLKVGSKNVGELFSEGGKDISVGAGLISAGVQTFNKAVQVFSNAVHEGFKKQTGSYENNFTNIAVRTGMSKTTYRNSQMALGGFGTNQLHEQGLMNNIRTSDVQDMWNKLAEKGMSQESIFASSLETVITKTLVPYLDTTSTEMQLLNTRVGDNGLLKTVRGISKLNQEMFDSNVVATKYLEEELTLLEPMSSAAEIDMIKNSAGGVAMLEKLQASGASLYDIAYMQKNSRQLMDLNKALQSSDMTVQLGAADAIIKGINTKTDAVGRNQSAINGITQIASMSPTNNFLSDIYSGSLGADSTSIYNLANLMEQGKITPELVSSLTSLGRSYGNKLPQASKEVTDALANDEFHTTKQLTEILAENLTNEVAAFAEMLGPWFEVLTTAVSGIATILGAKLLGKVGGKLFGKGASGGAGFFSNFANGTAGTVGGTLGNGLMNIGLAGGYSGGSVGAAQALGAVPAVASVAGIAGGGYMIYDGIKGFTDKNATALDKGVNAAEIAGGAAGVAGGAIVGSGVVAGLAGAGAANAWNPVGWGLLIAAGVTALGTAIYKGVKEQDEHNKALKDTLENNRALAKDIKTQWDNVNQTIKDEADTRVLSLEDMKDDLDRGRTFQSVKDELEQSGIASQEELNSLRDGDKKALQDLIDKYITETNRLSGEAQEFNNIFSEYEQDTVGGARNEIARFLNDHKGNEKGNANYDPVYDAVKAAVDRTYEKQRNGGSLSKTEEDLLDKWEWASKDSDVSRSDLKSLINKVGDQGIAQILTEEDLDKLARGRSGKTYGSHMTTYRSDMTDDNVVALLQNAFNAPTKEEALGYLNAAGYSPNSSNKAYKEAIAKIMGKTYPDGQIKYDEGSETYLRVGTDSIPYDNYPAMLHEGEAVLTASTANELRGLVDEYRATKEDNIKLEKAIQDQTAALVSRLDAIYNKIGNPDSDTSIMPRKIRQWKSNGQ